MAEQDETTGTQTTNTPSTEPQDGATTNPPTKAATKKKVAKKTAAKKTTTRKKTTKKKVAKKKTAKKAATKKTAKKKATPRKKVAKKTVATAARSEKAGENEEPTVNTRQIEALAARAASQLDSPPQRAEPIPEEPAQQEVVSEAIEEATARKEASPAAEAEPPRSVSEPQPAATDKVAEAPVSKGTSAPAGPRAKMADAASAQPSGVELRIELEKSKKAPAKSTDQGIPMRILLIVLCLVAAALYVQILVPEFNVVELVPAAMDSLSGDTQNTIEAAGNSNLRDVPESQMSIIREVFAPELGR